MGKYPFLLVAALLLFMVAGPSASVAQNPSDVLAEFDVFSDGDFLLAPVQVFGQTHLFLLDTGSDLTVYDIALPLGPPRQLASAHTPDGKVALKLFAAPPARIGNLPLPGNAMVAGIDLTPIRETQGHDIRGILGMDVLRRHIVRIDFDRGKVAFLRVLGPDPGQPTPLSFAASSPLPHVTMALGGMPAPFRLDTGMLADGAIRKEAAEELVLQQRAEPWGRVHATALSGSSTRQLFRVHKVRLQDWQQRNLFFREGNADAVGLGFLMRFQLTLDFPAGTAYLKPGKHFDRASTPNLTGINLTRRHGRTLINSVGDDTPAKKAGIQAGDEVIAVEDQPVQDHRLKTIDNLLATAARVTLSRAGAALQVKLTR